MFIATLRTDSPSSVRSDTCYHIPLLTELKSYFFFTS